ncbi:tetratricopeptide repeat protein 38-like isoform X1 [Tachypleus tridentatus]|uniref:tetratricopeptide repeat protein 38-like isoform X1 n=2 Tax=Tachypleus tridentatus TaxID=6853 RepID=UPI003FD52CAA
MIRSHFRGGKEWADEGLVLSTPSDQACKLFDSALSQLIGWYDDKRFGGLKTTLENIKIADPDFVMGHVMSLGIDLIGSGRTPQLDNSFKMEVETMDSLARKQAGSLTQREQSHVEAIKLWADGYLKEATDVLDDILVKHPTDMFAIRMAHDGYFYQGHLPQMRDSIARALPQWKTTTPLYSYLFGLYAFGLEETNFYSTAEKFARKGLDLNPNDAWATHALAHVFEMESRTSEGKAFMSSTVNNWELGNMLASHNFWHWGLYHIEEGELEAAIDIFDAQVGKRMHFGRSLGIDATSLLYRLELEGAQVKDRWREVFEICHTHMEDHILAFNDAHIFMSCLGAKEKNATRLMMNSLNEYLSESKGTNSEVTAKVGSKIIQALLAYDEERYEDVVALLYPVRYEIVQIGGSNAQRDVFNLLLIHAALKSSKRYHHCLAQSLLYERKAFRGTSPMMDRLMARALAFHKI